MGKYLGEFDGYMVYMHINHVQWQYIRLTQWEFTYNIDIYIYTYVCRPYIYIIGMYHGNSNVVIWDYIVVNNGVLEGLNGHISG